LQEIGAVQGRRRNPHAYSLALGTQIGPFTENDVFDVLTKDMHERAAHCIWKGSVGPHGGSGNAAVVSRPAAPFDHPCHE
jgi:hypothetical protein